MSHAYEHLAPLFAARDALPPGDPRRARLRQQLITGHLPVARHIARGHSGRGEDLRDLEQVAAIGLIHAVDRFTTDRGTPFLAFAVPTITGEVQRHHRDRVGTVRLPRAVRALRGAALAAAADLEQRRGAVPGTAEVAEHLGLGAGGAAEVRRSLVAGGCRSLDEPHRDGDDDRLRDAGLLGRTDDGLERAEDRSALAPLIATLTERQRRILALRFHHDLTQAEIGRRVGLTQMSVSRQLTAALDQLRGTLAG